LNEISHKNRNRLDKLCRSCHGNKKGGNLKKNEIFHQASRLLREIERTKMSGRIIIITRIAIAKQ
jgi:hypothetical protein